MPHLSIDRYIPVPHVVADPGRQAVSFPIANLLVTFRGDEARQFGDQYMAALAGLSVKGATAVEVDRG